MTSVYIDYPTREFCVKEGVRSADRFKHDKPNRRVVHLTHQNFSSEIRKFTGRQVQFSSTAEYNDLYVDLDFNDTEFEKATCLYIKRLLGERYTPIAEAVLR
jgi:hypothetical protein